MAESIGLRVADPRFWDPADLRSEVDRIFDICDSCRLCFKFCGSFPLLFEMIDSRTEANRERHLQEHPELVEQAARRLERATGRADVLAHHDDARVGGHAVAQCLRDAGHVLHLGRAGAQDVASV